VVTTGGTGIGPRDITPDVVMALADRLVPGVMEAIRVKFGAEHPGALLSRGVVAVRGRTLIYTLPGSVRAVEEYLGEILQTLEHALCMLHGLDTH
jgi:molybdopterin adenylyltransferase